MSSRLPAALGEMISLKTLSSRFVQLAVNGLTIITGFCAFLPLGYIRKYFSQCVLYASLDVLVKEIHGNLTVIVDMVTSVWGTSTNCDFATYVPLVAAIHAFIWSWFILFMAETLKKENREYYLLLPSFLLHSIMLLVMFVSSSIVSAGGDIFCRNLRRKLSSEYTCAQTSTMYWNIFGQKKHSIFRFLLIAKVSSWLMTLTILAQCLLTGYKLYQWFMQENPKDRVESTKEKSSSLKKKRTSHLVDGSDNGGYVEDSDDSADFENAFIHHDETGSLIRIL